LQATDEWVGLTNRSGQSGLAIAGAGRRPTYAFVPGEFLANLKSNEIETMEVYRGPSQLPMEAVGDACAAVFITTRYTTGSVLPK
jgi:hypothetical protein